MYNYDLKQNEVFHVIKLIGYSNMCVCSCIHTHIFTYIHTDIHTYIHTYRHRIAAAIANVDFIIFNVCAAVQKSVADRTKQHYMCWSHCGSRCSWWLICGCCIWWCCVPIGVVKRRSWWLSWPLSMSTATPATGERWGAQLLYFLGKKRSHCPLTN